MNITNEKQYKISKSWIKKFEDSLFELKQLPAEKGREWLRQSQEEALELQIDELKSQVSEYERVKSGKAKLPKPSAVAGVLRSVAQDLIKWRIAQGLTQKRLGQKLGVAEQQIQKYEQT
ncbi:MAG: helix-turn-helix domain-containing protein, partial [Candidatus Obscuribacterales bacterium]|nr:helix-turn-helix domain-containing protein [Candidatus Obscuribacterales bacterium]